MSEFEKWFAEQEFYTNMRFIHGDALFTKDDDVYRVLPVQMTYQAQTARQSEIDQLKVQLDTVNFFKKGDDSTIENATKVMNEMRGRISYLESSKKGYRDQVLELRKECDQLKAEKAGFQNLVKSLRSEFDLNGGSDQVERQIELLEEAVRGEHE